MHIRFIDSLPEKLLKCTNCVFNSSLWLKYYAFKNTLNFFSTECYKVPKIWSLNEFNYIRL